VLLVDYRGYGGNPGSPSEDGLARDIEAARTFLVEQAGIPAERLLYYGESLGAAVVTALAAKHPPAGLILRSPFTDLPAAGREHYPFLPVRLLARDRFPVAEVVARVAAPTLIVYGTADSIVPPRQSLAVAGKAGGPVRVVAVQGADHNDASLQRRPAHRRDRRAGRRSHLSRARRPEVDRGQAPRYQHAALPDQPGCRAGRRRTAGIR
jgi:fermentation-respiration switch protein FrsA (DUF1100 family)